MKMKSKMVALFATLMIALMAVGIAYAMWDKTLYIIGTVDTGKVDAHFTTATSNDPGTTIDPGKDKHVGCTEVTGVGLQTLTITVTNGYPCYESTIDYTIDNIGTIPVKVQRWTVTPILDGDVTVTITTIAVGTQIDAGASVPGDIHIHVEQSADELATYTFSVEIYLVQWNEYVS
jgi:hypothetical protein